jgi:hypothetical protein
MPGRRSGAEDPFRGLVGETPTFTGVIMLKVGTLDDRKVYEGPQMVIWTAEPQPFHLAPEGVPQTPGFPGR